MPVRPSLNGLIRRTVDIQATRIVQEEIAKLPESDTTTASVIKTVPTMVDLDALPVEQRLEGVIYIVLADDLQFLYDPNTDGFISRVHEFDGGVF